MRLINYIIVYDKIEVNEFRINFLLYVFGIIFFILYAYAGMIYRLGTFQFEFLNSPYLNFVAHFFPSCLVVHTHFRNGNQI